MSNDNDEYEGIRYMGIAVVLFFIAAALKECGVF